MGSAVVMALDFGTEGPGSIPETVYVVYVRIKFVVPKAPLSVVSTLTCQVGWG